jgi:hypothetical protein
VPGANVVSVFNILSGAVALLVSYYAYKSNRIVGNNLLRYISIGFLLLGISLFLEAGTENLARITPVDAVRVRGAELGAFLVYTSLQFVAYLVFAWGYVLSSLRRPDSQAPAEAPPTTPATGAGPALIGALAVRAVAVATFILTIYLVSQLAIVILLLFIVYHGVLVFSKTKSNLALMVLFGFILIFVAHVLLFSSAIFTSGGLLLIGDTIQFCGFVALLFFLYWSGRVVR